MCFDLVLARIINKIKILNETPAFWSKDRSNFVQILKKFKESLIQTPKEF